MLQIPAAVRFVSYEPTLGPVDFTQIPIETMAYPWSMQKLRWRTNVLTGKSAEVQGPNFNQHLHWVIAGCESGPGRRPADIKWFRSVRDQCRDAGVPFFLKQMEIDGAIDHMPELDGRVWDQVPEEAVFLGMQ